MKSAEGPEDPGDIAAWQRIIGDQSLSKISGHRPVGAVQQIGSSADQRVINAVIRLVLA